METFIVYIIKVAVCLGAFLSIYAIFLRKTTFFKFNRFFLIAGFIISLVIPSIKPTYDVVISVSVPATVMDAVPEVSAPVVASLPSFNPWYLLVAIYLVGILLFLIRNIYSYLKIAKLIKNGIKTKNNGFVLIENMSIKSAFTVLHYILLNPTLLSKTEKDMILKHELTHINQKHWIDLLCSECMLLLQWFNPLAWIYVRLLKENHEFLADKAVIDSGISPYLYQAVLINQEFQGPVFSFSNSFNYSNPLNRLSMIKKEKSASWKRFAALAIIPMFGLFLWASAEPNYIVNSPIDFSANDTIPEVVTYEIQMIDEEGTGEKKDYQFFITENDNSESKSVATYHFKIGDKIEDSNIKDSLTLTASTISLSMSDTIRKKTSLFIQGTEGKEPLIIVDGKKVASMDDINHDNIDNINVLKGKSATDIYGEEGENGVIMVSTKDGDDGKLKGKVQTVLIKKNGNNSTSSVFLKGVSSFNDKKPLIMVDGEKAENIDDIKVDDIESFSILKDKAATETYGEEAKDGVILITTKKNKKD